jgi:hypothetical protein
MHLIVILHVLIFGFEVIVWFLHLKNLIKALFLGKALYALNNWKPPSLFSFFY